VADSARVSASQESSSLFHRQTLTTSPPTPHQPRSLENLFETISIDISAGPSIYQSASSPAFSYPAESTTMASGQPFASRSYAGTKLPDRSGNPNAMPFSASSFSRHRGLGNTAPADFGGPEGPKQAQQPTSAPAATQSHGPGQDANPLSRLTEEQREEINEAVRNVSRSMPRLSATVSIVLDERDMQSNHQTYLPNKGNTAGTRRNS
jgi:hypothetical protein